MSISYPESLKSYLKMDYGSNLAVSVSKMVYFFRNQNQKWFLVISFTFYVLIFFFFFFLCRLSLRSNHFTINMRRISAPQRVLIFTYL